MLVNNPQIKATGSNTRAKIRGFLNFLSTDFDPLVISFYTKALLVAMRTGKLSCVWGMICKKDFPEAASENLVTFGTDVGDIVIIIF